jgi:hypothetical protein
MNGADRKTAKASIRAALGAKERGLPLSPHEQAVMLWIDSLRASQGDAAAKRVLSWAIGTSLTIIAYHERIGETIQNRIDQGLDSMRREFSGRE